MQSQGIPFCGNEHDFEHHLRYHHVHDQHYHKGDQSESYHNHLHQNFTFYVHPACEALWWFYRAGIIPLTCIGVAGNMMIVATWIRFSAEGRRAARSARSSTATDSQSTKYKSPDNKSIKSADNKSIRSADNKSIRSADNKSLDNKSLRSSDTKSFRSSDLRSPRSQENKSSAKTSLEEKSSNLQPNWMSNLWLRKNQSHIVTDLQTQKEPREISPPDGVNTNCNYNGAGYRSHDKVSVSYHRSGVDNRCHMERKNGEGDVVGEGAQANRLKSVDEGNETEREWDLKEKGVYSQSWVNCLSRVRLEYHPVRYIMMVLAVTQSFYMLLFHVDFYFNLDLLHRHLSHDNKTLDSMVTMWIPLLHIHYLWVPYITGNCLPVTFLYIINIQFLLIIIQFLWLKNGLKSPNLPFFTCCRITLYMLLLMVWVTALYVAHQIFGPYLSQPVLGHSLNFGGIYWPILIQQVYVVRIIILRRKRRRIRQVIVQKTQAGTSTDLASYPRVSTPHPSKRTMASFDGMQSGTAIKPRTLITSSPQASIKSPARMGGQAYYMISSLSPWSSSKEIPAGELYAPSPVAQGGDRFSSTITNSKVAVDNSHRKDPSSILTGNIDHDASPDKEGISTRSTTNSHLTPSLTKYSKSDKTIVSVSESMIKPRPNIQKPGILTDAMHPRRTDTERKMRRVSLSGPLMWHSTSTPQQFQPPPYVVEQPSTSQEVSARSESQSQSVQSTKQSSSEKTQPESTGSSRRSEHLHRTSAEMLEIHALHARRKQQQERKEYFHSSEKPCIMKDDVSVYNVSELSLGTARSVRFSQQGKEPITVGQQVEKDPQELQDIISCSTAASHKTSAYIYLKRHSDEGNTWELMMRKREEARMALVVMIISVVNLITYVPVLLVGDIYSLLDERQRDNALFFFALLDLIVFVNFSYPFFLLNAFLQSINGRYRKSPLKRSRGLISPLEGSAEEYTTSPPLKRWRRAKVVLLRAVPGFRNGRKLSRIMSPQPKRKELSASPIAQVSLAAVSPYPMTQRKQEKADEEEAITSSPSSSSTEITPDMDTTGHIVTEDFSSSSGSWASDFSSTSTSGSTHSTSSRSTSQTASAPALPSTKEVGTVDVTVVTADNASLAPSEW